jgi:hypothetical protein
VPTSERPFKNTSDLLFDSRLQQQNLEKSMRDQKLRSMQGQDRTLMLAGTMALKMGRTPSDVLRERKGFLTSFKIPKIID